MSNMKRLIIRYVLDGKTRTGECYVSNEEPNSMSQIINDLELIAEGYLVNVEVVDEGVV